MGILHRKISERFENKLVRILSPLNEPEWNNYVKDNNSYSFFHTKEWASLLASSYGYEPVYFCILKENKIISILPTMLIKNIFGSARLISLPFSDYCEPLLNSIEDGVILKNAAFHYCQINKIKFVEFRFLKIRKPEDKQYYRMDFIHVLRLDKPEPELFKALSENTRRNIKKAQKANVNISIMNNESGLKIFYDMFCLTRKKHGLPPQPFHFFKNILESIIKPGYGDILLATHNNKYIAGAVYFKFEKKVIYKYGASYTQSNDLRGNNAIMWYAIKKYRGEHFYEFDFGRTEFNHEGLRRFKLGWNAEERFIYTSRYNIKKKQYLPTNSKTIGFYNKLFKVTPVFLLRIIGKLLYKHIG